MSTAKDPSLRGLNDCGCCEGLEVTVPSEIYNRPGLKAIAYRVGTHNQFRDSLLGRLSAKDFPTLRELTTREPDDFTIAFLDAWATAADVLTFYQERIANEAFLRTAREELSIQELAALTGYTLNPGVAAEAYLAFTLEEPPSAEATGTGPSGTRALSQAAGAALRRTAALIPEEISIPLGTKVQSVPGPGEEAQVFETVEAIKGRPQWNRIGLQLTTCQPLNLSANSLLFLKTSLNLKLGGRLLIFDGQKAVVRQISQPPKEDLDSQTTLVELADKSEIPNQSLPQDSEGIYALHNCASLFGHNAVASELLPSDIDPGYEDAANWPKTSSNLDLDAVYPQIAPQSLVVVASGGELVNAIIARVNSVQEVGASGYGLSARVTRLGLDKNIQIKNMDDLRHTVVYLQSEILELADIPDTKPVNESPLKVDMVYADLAKDQTIIISGMLDNKSGTWMSEAARIQSVGQEDDRTLIHLVENLVNTYQRDTVSINANVARATHGETVQEILGSGDGGQGFQSFVLKQTPLTYTSATTPSGTESTLKVYVNDLLWKEVPNLLSSGPNDRHYRVRKDSEGRTIIQFGDGQNGARLPSGQSNVKAVYRKGLGLAGRVKKDRLSVLLTKPYGLKEVTNPCGAEGGDDPENRALARTNAPLKVKTLDRAVSLQDYQDFSLAFAGIAKALAIWGSFGEKKGVFLTIAESQGPGQAAASGAATSELSVDRKLYDALDKAGPPRVPIRVEFCRKVTFRLGLCIKVNPIYQPDKVKAAAKSALRTAFSFDNRSLAQPVFLSEVMAVVQSVPGVDAVDVNNLYRDGETPQRNDRLPAEPPEVNSDGTCTGAELLTLSTDELDELGDMP